MKNVVKILRDVGEAVVAEICEAKRRQRIVPAIATPLEIQRALKALGVTTSFKDIDAAAESDPLIRKHRLLRYNGYEYANDAETDA